MYKALLISKYLRKRRIAWVSLLAVCLCTAMVLVVFSVMGGWLRMFRDSFQGLSGAVLVQSGSLAGFPHYEAMLDRIRADPDVTAATPVIETFGLLNIANRKTTPVQVMGLQPEGIGKVNRFPQSLYRQYRQLLREADDPEADLTAEQRQALREQARRNRISPSFELPLPPEVYRSILPGARTDVARFPGMVAGSGVLNITRDREGNEIGRGPGLYMLWARLTVLGIRDGERIEIADKAEPVFWIVDDSRTKLWHFDSNYVYVPFDVLQRDLGMERLVEEDGVEVEPARTSSLHIAVREGADRLLVRDRVQRIVDDVLAERGLVMSQPPTAMTWEETQIRFLAAVENEVVLVTTLFSFISLVSVFLIFCIFYMIVAEKTRDIGIIKSVGATSSGVAAIFIGYGCAIGIVGGLMGLALGHGVVLNINWIHAQMGNLLGITIWSPDVYAFDKIPSEVDPRAAAIVFAVAVVFSALGAVVPAIRAGRLNPVEAVRFE